MNSKYLICLMLSFVIGLTKADRCIECSTEITGNCSANTDLFLYRSCINQSSNAGCYTRIINQHTVRGCTVDLDPDVIAQCRDPSNPNCLLCFGVGGNEANGCNSGSFPTHRLNCHQCTGPNTEECGAEILTSAFPCPLYQAVDDKCFIRKTESAIERGCLSSIVDTDLCKNVTECYICNGNGCNTLVHTNALVPTLPDSASMHKVSLAAIMVSFAFLFMSKFSF